MGLPRAHPAVGAFAPELTLHTATGTVRLAELARTARPLLIDLTENASAAKALADRSDRIDIVTARPGPDTDSTATALLLRPDSYVAWATDAPRPDAAALDDLQAAARRWFGSTRPRSTPE
ncbi:hypothetical protein [Streptomyces sp. NPDC093707]|uniref:aromatic-ring hydroxylase C-terminal domain-containing protein n=1 Tax=Streptomyces sp. NPDC093707 TaxID=3154984 RepID=UPI00344D4E90